MSTFDEVQQFVAAWGTIYFGVIFVAALAYALAPSKKSTFEHAAAIPLRED
jgi:cytochrome c oxidase cbb3-type subunit IV